MSGARFTPGPWEVWKDHLGVFAGPAKRNTPGEISGTRAQVCEVDDDWNERLPVGEREANARLIAAAPDLYTQGLLALGFLKANDGEGAAWIARGLEAALAKARGEW